MFPVLPAEELPGAEEPSETLLPQGFVIPGLPTGAAFLFSRFSIPTSASITVLTA